MADESSNVQEDCKRAESTSGSASSVWSLCDDGDHVDLGDITPSISPVVFTDDQVRQITQQNSEIDVLSTPFLPGETFKQINDGLLMTCGTPMLVQDAINYTAADLGSGFHHDQSPLKRDVLLHDAEDIKLDLFPGLIGGLGEQRPSRELDVNTKIHGKKETPSAKEEAESVNEEDEPKKGKGNTYSLRRSSRKQPQQKSEAAKKVDSKQGNKANTKANNAKEAPQEHAEPATRRRSPRTKLEQGTAGEQDNNKKKVVATEKGDGKKQGTGLKPDEVLKNVRRSPRNQKKPEPEKNSKETPPQKRGRGGRNKGEEKEVALSSESSNKVDKKEGSLLSEESTVDVEEGKDGKGAQRNRFPRKAGQDAGTVKITESVENDNAVAKISVKLQKGENENEGEEKDADNSNGNEQRRRRSSRVALHKQKGKPEDKEEKKVKSVESETVPQIVSSTTEEIESKESKVQDKKEDSSDKEGDKKKRQNETTDSSKSSQKALEKVSLSRLKSDNGDDKKKQQESKPKLQEETQVEVVKTPKRKERTRREEEEEEKKKKKSEREEEKKKKNETEKEPEKGETKSRRIRKATEKGREYFQESKKEKTENEQEVQEEKEREEKEEEVEEEEEPESSESEAEEDDSDYDPENDPERLWCICRKPHGNRFMICCDSCEMWFHGDCVGISMSQGRQMEKIGKDYVCPKCKVAREKESPKHKADSAKLKEESQEKGTGHPERRHRHSRLKLPSDLPRDKHKKHKHSSKEHIRGSHAVSSFYKSDDGKSKVHTRDEGKRKSHEQTGFKIPKKVRTTPTPVSYKMNQSKQNCILTGCGNLALMNSLYCSDECIKRHADDSLRALHAEKQKQLGNKSQLPKSTASPTSNLSSPLPWETNAPSSVTSSVEPHSREGVAVWEKTTGRVIAGVAAPSEEELVSWLRKHPTFSVLKPTVSKDDRKKEKKDDEKTIRENVRRSLKEILTTRGREADAPVLNPDDVTKCAVTVEEELFKVFSDTGPRYKNKYRSLMFNLKDPRNKMLFQHVLSGEIPADRLVRMTPEQLASHELAKWREREVKHTLEMIKQTQESSKLQVVKKTHKGEVAIDEDEDMSSLETTVKPQAESEEVSDLPDSNTSSTTLLIDTTDEHRVHLFDLNCRICTGKITPPGELPKKEPAIPLVSTTTIVQAVAESSIPSPPPTVEASSVSSPDSVSTASVPYSPPPTVKPTKKIPAVWKGFVMMGGVAKFSTHAYRVSGPCDDLLQLLPDTLHVQGRIAFAQVWDYIYQLKSSTTRDISLIRYEASSDEEKISYVSLYSYFYSRKRCGVISNCYSGVKDMYVVPLASHQPVPPELLPFNGPGLDEPRPHMLLGVIVRTKAVFKRPRAINQRSASPPRKRRPSSGSTGSGNESPLRDSPVAEIDDIVFQYHSGQTKKAASADVMGTTATTPSKKSSLPTTASSETTSSGTTPSETSSSSVQASPGQEKTTPLHVQKQQLLELQERARHYILAQVQNKGPNSSEIPLATGLSGKTSDGSEPYDPEVGTEDDAPYDPEEELPLDLGPKSEESKVPKESGSVSSVMADLVNAGAAKSPQIPQPIVASLSSTASIQSHPLLTPVTSGVLRQSSRMNTSSTPDPHLSQQPQMQSSRIDTNSGPGPQKSLPSLMQSTRMNIGSSLGRPQQQSTWMNIASSPVFPGVAPKKEGDSHGKAEGPVDGPREGLSQQDRMKRPHPTPGESRLVMPDPPKIARTVSNFRQRAPEGPHSDPRDSTQSYGDRVPPQQAPGGPHQRAPYDNAPPISRDADRERRYHREEPEPHYPRDPRAPRDPGYQDDWRNRRDPYGPPRRWSEGDRYRDRNRGHDREPPYGRYEGPYDERRRYEDERGRYEDFRRDDRRHEDYRRERWRR